MALRDIHKQDSQLCSGLYFQMPHSLIDLERNEQQDLQMQTPFIVKLMDVAGKEHKRKPLCQNLVLEDLD
jgi:hypothetical protein